MGENPRYSTNTLEFIPPSLLFFITTPWGAGRVANRRMNLQYSSWIMSQGTMKSTVIIMMITITLEQHVERLWSVQEASATLMRVVMGTVSHALTSILWNIVSLTASLKRVQTPVWRSVSRPLLLHPVSLPTYTLGHRPRKVRLHQPLTLPYSRRQNRLQVSKQQLWAMGKSSIAIAIVSFMI